VQGGELSTKSANERNTLCSNKRCVLGGVERLIDLGSWGEGDIAIVNTEDQSEVVRGSGERAVDRGGNLIEVYAKTTENRGPKFTRDESEVGDRTTISMDVNVKGNGKEREGI